MKLTLRRIISILTLLATLVTLILILKKPAPVAQPQARAAIAENAQSFDRKMAQFQQETQASGATITPTSQSGPSTKPEVRITSDEMEAVLAQSLGTDHATPAQPTDPNSAAAPSIKDQRVSFEGDQVHGQLLVEVEGKDLWITISGHLGAKDGYATFDPTEFKVGDLSFPASLVNPALQKKLGEVREQLKLPDNVGDLKIENGELVMQGK